MKNASLTRQAAEFMAERSYHSGRTIEDLFGSKYHVEFWVRGHTPDESIDAHVDITPELMAQAEAILKQWMTP